MFESVNIPCRVGPKTRFTPFAPKYFANSVIILNSSAFDLNGKKLKTLYDYSLNDETDFKLYYFESAKIIVSL